MVLIDGIEELLKSGKGEKLVRHLIKYTKQENNSRFLLIGVGNDSSVKYKVKDEILADSISKNSLIFAGYSKDQMMSIIMQQLTGVTELFYKDSLNYLKAVLHIGDVR